MSIPHSNADNARDVKAIGETAEDVILPPEAADGPQQLESGELEVLRHSKTRLFLLGSIMMLTYFLSVSLSLHFISQRCALCKHLG